MKIVHLITTLGVGGAEKHLLWLGEGQRAAGHEVSVLYLKGEGELGDAFSAAGIPTQKIPFESLGDLWRALGGIRRRLKDLQPDVLHSHLLKADALSALVGHRAGVPVVDRGNGQRICVITENLPPPNRRHRLLDHRFYMLCWWKPKGECGTISCVKQS